MSKAEHKFKRISFFLSLLVVSISFLYFSTSKTINNKENQNFKLLESNIELKKQVAELEFDSDAHIIQIDDLNKVIQELNTSKSENDYSMYNISDRVNQKSLAIVGGFHLIDLIRTNQFKRVHEMISNPYHKYEFEDDALTGYVKEIFSLKEKLTFNWDDDNRKGFIISDTDGNEVYFSYEIYEDKMYFYSVLLRLSDYSQMVNSFVELLKVQDVESLQKLLTEIDIKPTIAETEDIIDLYSAIYDLDSIGIEFMNIHKNSVKFKLFGQKNGVYKEEYLHVAYEAGIVFILDYNGRKEWRE